MRAALPIALLLAISAALAGCNDDGDHEDCEPGHVDEHCPADTTSTPPPTGPTPPPTTTSEPNSPPTIALKVTVNGTETNVTTKGTFMTFDVSGSRDIDGEIVDAAISVILANQTASGVAPRSLMQGTSFAPVTFNMSSPGPAKVSVAVVDDDGEIVILDTMAYVNDPKDAGTYGFKAASASGSDPTKCVGTVEENAPAGQEATAAAIDEAYFHKFNFIVPQGASFVEAAVAAGSASIAICNPEGLPISAAGTANVTSDAAAVVAPGTDYYVAVFSTANPTPPATDQDVSIRVTIHFEPR